ncbi:MAG: hypothetical protein GX238_01115 [Epulopiscium sp.]|nr:hypothetical protein [Candidatus Epulonipiscium sp.]
MDNKKLIENKVKSLGYLIGCYNSEMEKVSKEELEKVLEALDFADHTDVSIFINKKEYIVEIATVDDEIDFNIMSKQEYASTYGRM